MANIYNKVEKIVIGEIVYGVMVVQHGDGRLRYINVQKLSQNPWISMGKDYNSWDECINKYKNEKMKKGLLEIKERYDLICVPEKPIAKKVAKKVEKPIEKPIAKKVQRYNNDDVIALNYALLKNNNILINC